MVKFCTGCGASISNDSAAFCDKCGAKLPASSSGSDKLKTAGKWIAICCGGAILCVIIAAFVYGIAGNASSPSSTIQPSSNTLSSTAKPTVITTTSQSGVPTEVDLDIGKTASNPVQSVTVYSAEKTTKYYWTGSSGTKYPVNAKSGYNYILVDAEIKNIGTDNMYASQGDFSMSDSEGNRYDPIPYSGDDGIGYLKELYKNQKVRGKILFEVPQNAKNLKLYYNFGNLFSGIHLAAWSII